MKTKETRRREANERNAARAKRSDKEQCRLLATRPGISERETVRLSRKMKSLPPGYTLGGNPADDSFHLVKAR